MLPAISTQVPAFSFKTLCDQMSFNFIAGSNGTMSAFVAKEYHTKIFSRRIRISKMCVYLVQHFGEQVFEELV